MHVLAIYAVNEHLADLLAEAHAERMIRGTKPRRSLRHRVTSLFASRGTAVAAPSAS